MKRTLAIVCGIAAALLGTLPATAAIVWQDDVNNENDGEGAWSPRWTRQGWVSPAYVPIHDDCYTRNLGSDDWWLSNFAPTSDTHGKYYREACGYYSTVDYSNGNWPTYTIADGVKVDMDMKFSDADSSSSGGIKVLFHFKDVRGTTVTGYNGRAGYMVEISEYYSAWRVKVFRGYGDTHGGHQVGDTVSIAHPGTGESDMTTHHLQVKATGDLDTCNIKVYWDDMVTPLIDLVDTGDATYGLAYTNNNKTAYDYTGGRVGVGVTYGHTWYWKNTVVQSPVPEPATMGLLGLGFAGMAVLRRRRRNK